ncbi:MAG: 30S ribosomal protein S16 [Gammaproteobacteria bacterium WSBS_2016_MAG_OTU1]
MLVIRLARGGSKKRPFYHIVVTDKKNSRDGRFVERIGFSNPIASGKAESIRINMERFKHWREIGAIPSPTVSRLTRAYRRIVA